LFHSVRLDDHRLIVCLHNVRFLQSVNPLWHLLGRVTFHVAENKRDESCPFAFLATFTSRLSGQARLQHIPLAEALKLYAAANDREKLESLLEPVRRAAAKSPVVRELLDTKQLFAPQAWTIRQTYRFLTESVAMEEAGVVVRMPNWWSARQPPRPQVRVKIGGKFLQIKCNSVWFIMRCGELNNSREFCQFSPT
jgi:non-specific serine/threonine protein kinase